MVKYDFLILKSVKVIRDACSYIGINYPRSHEMDFEDDAVWDSLGDNQAMLFQFESPFAAECFKKFRPRNILEMSQLNASLRPSGASYRDQLIKRITHKNPSELIDKLLERNNGWLIFQEDVIRFMTDDCGDVGTSGC